MAFNRRYRRFRGRARRTRRMGGIKRRFRGRRTMTTGRVKRIIDAELKVKDVIAVQLPIDDAIGAVVSLSTIAQGDGNDQRTGNWIKPVSLMGTLTTTGVDGIVPDSSMVRISIVVWMENQDTDPITLDRILQVASQPHQQFNVESKGSFKILWSRPFNVVNQDNNPQFLRTHRFYVKPSMKVLYDDADQRKFQLFLVASSDKAALSGDEPLLSFNTRLRYTDS